MKRVLLAVAGSLLMAACGGGGSSAEDAPSAPSASGGVDAVAAVGRETGSATAPADVWTFIANEGQSFQVTGTQTVRYGQGSTWIQRSVTNSGQCTNSFFGSDPLFGIVKRCEVLSSPPPPPSEVWTFIANEGQSFQVTGTQTVRYGQGSTWIQRSVTGSGQCTNGFFGSDPLFGVVKRCEVLSTAAPPGNTANDGSPLGTNLAGLSYFSTQVPLIDLFKTSSPWISGSATAWSDGRGFDLDSEGWIKSLQPGQIARTLMLRGPGVYPIGKYVVLYEGQGTLEYVFGWRKVAAESSPGRDVVEATGSVGDIGLYITATNPATPLRNIRVLLPGGICGSDAFVHAAAASDCPGNFRSFEQVHATLIFNPVFLERTRKYKVLRYMNWMETNTENQDGTWAARPRLTHARWTDQGGVPFEVLIELANRLNAYPWFNMPHRASDDYVRNFAQTVRDKLAPTLKVYLEYSNETWNPDFPASRYAEAQAQALGIAAPDAYTTRIRYHARRAPQIFDLWSSVFAGNARLVRVLGGQVPSTYLADVVASFENAYLKADAIGLNAYFSLDELDTVAGAERFAALTNAQAFAELRAKALTAFVADVQAQVATISKYKLKVMAFEGGNSLWPRGPGQSNANLTAKLNSIQRDPEMKTLYTEFLNSWFNAGGHLMMHFTDIASYSAAGGWFGSLEYLAQPRAEAPKYDGLMSFIDNNPNRITP
jgi:hypothetical protein